MIIVNKNRFAHNDLDDIGSQQVWGASTSNGLSGNWQSAPDLIREIRNMRINPMESEKAEIKPCPVCGTTLQDLYELDPNQDLPENPHVDQDAKDSCWPDSPYEGVYRLAQQDMVNAGWRKVKNAKE